MQPITINIKQKGKKGIKPKQCEARIFEHEGKVMIDLDFKPSFPQMEGTMYEKIVIAIFNAVKEK